jgi:hypothetical protein
MSVLMPVRTMLAIGVMVASLSARAMPAQQAPPLPDIGTLGPQIGERVPDFTLPDQGASRARSNC